MTSGFERGFAFAVAVVGLLAFMQEANGKPNCANPFALARSVGEDAVIVKDAHTIRTIRRIVTERVGEPVPFTTAVVLFGDQRLSIGIGTDEIVCETVVENGVDAVKTSEFIFPKKT